MHVSAGTDDTDQGLLSKRGDQRNIKTGGPIRLNKQFINLRRSKVTTSGHY
jgi:hypothetical protein